MRARNEIGLESLANQRDQQIWTDTDGVWELDLVGGMSRDCMVGGSSSRSSRM